MKKILLLLALVLTPIAAVAQSQIGQAQIVNVIDSGTACVTAPTACASFQLASQPAVAISIAGTWTGTLTFEGQVLASPFATMVVTKMSDGTGVSTTTANNTFSVPNIGFTNIRVRATGAMTGTATVSAAQGFLSAKAAAGTSGVNSLSATANQTTVSSGTGDITVGTVQDIGTASAVQHGSISVGATLDSTAKAYCFRSINTAASSQRNCFLALSQVNATTAGVNITDNYQAVHSSFQILAGDGTKSMNEGSGTFSEAGNANTNISNVWTGSLSHVSANTGTAAAGTSMTAYRSSIDHNSSGLIDTIRGYWVSDLGMPNGGTANHFAAFDVQSGLSAIVASVPDMYSFRTQDTGMKNRFDGPTSFGRTIGFGTTSVSVFGSATAPTIASGGCTSPAVTWNNGTAAFLLTIGTSCTGVKTITLTMPAAAHFWACDAQDNTSNGQQASNQPVSLATATTTIVITNYARTTGLSTDFTASDTLLVKCLAG